MPSAPFGIRSLRFDRRTPGLIVNLRPEGSAPIAGADWDASRDSTAAFDSPTAFVAIVTGAKPTSIEIHVRLTAFPSWQRWQVSARVAKNVKAQQVAFRTIDFQPVPACVSREFSFILQDDRLLSPAVGRHEIEWHWFGRYIDPGTGALDQEQYLGATRFVAYTIPALPQAAPWSQHSSIHPDHDLPWIPVIDWSCRNAAGATTPLEAAAAVTRALYGLGSWVRVQQGFQRFKYGGVDDFLCDEEHHLFRCGAFLRALTHPGTGTLEVSCEDLAAAVCVFSNVLGADLERLQFDVPGTKLPLAKLKLIGEKSTTPTDWSHHEVARSRGNGHVFDACVQLRELGSSKWSSPAGIPLGAGQAAEYNGYLQRLLTASFGDCRLDPQVSPVLDRPRAGTVPPGPVSRRLSGILALLEPYTSAMAYPRPSAQFAFFPPGMFAELDERLRGSGTRASFEWPTGDRVAVEWSPTALDAVRLAAWRLSFFHGFTQPPSGSMAPVFKSEDRRQAVGLVANLVFEIRAAQDSGDPIVPFWDQLIGALAPPPPPAPLPSL